MARKNRRRSRKRIKDYSETVTVELQAQSAGEKIFFIPFELLIKDIQGRAYTFKSVKLTAPAQLFPWNSTTQFAGNPQPYRLKWIPPTGESNRPVTRFHRPKLPAEKEVVQPKTDGIIIELEEVETKAIATSFMIETHIHTFHDDEPRNETVNVAFKSREALRRFDQELRQQMLTEALNYVEPEPEPALEVAPAA